MTSQINPSNINEQYPVAGQPNNTQGFRDNFTATQTNFNYAATEITDLQNKAVLKAALTGTTLDNNMNDALIYAAKIQDFSATAVNLTTTSGPVTVNYTTGHYQSLSPSTGSVTLGFTNWPVSGNYGYIRLRIYITNTAYTVSLPAAATQGITGIQGLSGSTITFSATGYYEFAFSTVDGGNTITVFDLNRPLSYYTNPVTINSNVASTSTTSGALIVAGGVGVAGNLYVAGNIVGDFVATTQTFSGNLTGGNLLTAGITSATGNVTGGNLRTAGQVSAAGNVTGNYFIGNGSALTGIVVSGGASIVNGNSNVVVVANSNVTIGISGTSNIAVWANTGGYITGLLSTTGNVIGGNLSTAGQVSAAGNITGGNIIAGVGIGVAGDIGVGGIIYANGNISTGSSINAIGNVTGSYFLGNGSLLSGLSSSSRIISGTTQIAIDVPSGNIQTSVGGTPNVVVFTTGGVGIDGYMLATGNVVGSNITANGAVEVTGLISAAGNVTGGNIRTAGLISAVGNITSGPITVTGNIALTANVIAGNLTTGSQVVALGNVTGGNIRTTGQILAQSATALPAGGAAGAGYLFSSTSNFGVFFGSGAPTLSAAKGSLYLRSDGSTTNNRMYVNTDGATTWTAVITAA